MSCIKVILLLCFVSASLAQETDVTPVLNPLDLRVANLEPEPKSDNLAHRDNEVATNVVAIESETKVATSGVVVGICAIHDVLTSANITHEQVAEFILRRTPIKYRSKLYTEFVKGGTTFVARVTNVGCSMIKIKSILSKMWPFGRLFHVMLTVMKPFGGLQHSDEFQLLHEAIEYIEKNRGREGLMVIPDTMCYIRRVSRDRKITKEEVIAEVESKLPEELKKSWADKIFRFGVNSVARIADVACKTLPVHVEVDVKNHEVRKEEETAMAVVPASGDVQPAAIHIPFMLGTAAFCELHKQLQQRGVSHEKIIETINRIIPKPFRKHLIQKLTREGVDKLALVANVGCKVMPRLRIVEESESSVLPAGAVTDMILKRESFCRLLDLGRQMGVSKAGVSQFIRTEFPDKWRKSLLGQLFERGIQAVVDVAHRMCFAAN